MNGAKRKFGLKHGLALVVGLAVVLGLALAYIIASGLADLWARRTIVDQLEKATGARVELGNFHFAWRTLGARFDGLTLHGREAQGAPPLFHADRLTFDIHVESFWGRKISLGNVLMSHFSVNVHVAKDGSTNLPGPKVQAGTGKLPVQNLIDLKIAQLRLEDGEIVWNDQRTPFTAQGGKFAFAMDYASDSTGPLYLGQTSWQQCEISALKFLPLTSNVSARFALRADSFSVTQLQWKTLHSEIDAQANLASFASPAWDFKYRVQLRFEDAWSILRLKDAPPGRVEFVGDARYAGDVWSAGGRYSAGPVSMEVGPSRERGQAPRSGSESRGAEGWGW